MYVCVCVCVCALLVRNKVSWVQTLTDEYGEATLMLGQVKFQYVHYVFPCVCVCVSVCVFLSLSLSLSVYINMLTFC